MEWFLVGFLVSFIGASFSGPAKTTTMDVNPVIERTADRPSQPDLDYKVVSPVVSPVASVQALPQN